MIGQHGGRDRGHDAQHLPDPPGDLARVTVRALADTAEQIALGPEDPVVAGHDALPHARVSGCAELAGAGVPATRNRSSNGPAPAGVSRIRVTGGKRRGCTHSSGNSDGSSTAQTAAPYHSPVLCLTSGPILVQALATMTTRPATLPRYASRKVVAPIRSPARRTVPGCAPPHATSG